MLTTAVAFLIAIPGIGDAQAKLDFRNTVTGEPLDLGAAPPEGADTPAVEKFLATGVNPYNEKKSCLPLGEERFLTACSGCHGHVAEGKIGPALNDSYWRYEKNATDKGLFETIFGGATGQMGPMYGHLSLDDMLLAMSWIRHLYTGTAAEAEWLNDEQRKAFKPYAALSTPEGNGVNGTDARSTVGSGSPNPPPTEVRGTPEPSPAEAEKLCRSEK